MVILYLCIKYECGPTKIAMCKVFTSLFSVIGPNWSKLVQFGPDICSMLTKVNRLFDMAILCHVRYECDETKIVMCKVFTSDWSKLVQLVQILVRG